MLFAPSILLFSLSGIFQMYGCHEGEGGDEPAGWIVRLSQVHMKQTASMPRRRPAAPPKPSPVVSQGSGSGSASAAPAEARPAGPPRQASSTAPLKAFFLLMSLGLIATTFLGLYIAFTSPRDRRLQLGLLAAGIVIPIVLLVL